MKIQPRFKIQYPMKNRNKSTTFIDISYTRIGYFLFYQHSKK